MLAWRSLLTSAALLLSYLLSRGTTNAQAKCIAPSTRGWVPGNLSTSTQAVCGQYFKTCPRDGLQKLGVGSKLFFTCRTNSSDYLVTSYYIVNNTRMEGNRCEEPVSNDFRLRFIRPNNDDQSFRQVTVYVDSVTKPINISIQCVARSTGFDQVNSTDVNAQTVLRIIFERVVCEPSDPTSNGFITYSPRLTPQYDVGTTASYHCADGYVLSGNSTRECVFNGSSTYWTDTTPLCERAAGSKQMATTAIIAFTLVIVYVATVDSELAI